MNAKIFWHGLLLSLFFGGSSIAVAQQEASSGNINSVTKTLVIYDEGKNLDRHPWIAAGWMPDGGGIAIDENCGTNPFCGESCIRIDVDLSSHDWVGINWLPKGSDPWTSKGVDVWKALNTGEDGNVRVTFYAKGENGEEAVEFKCGGKTKSPNSDSMRFAKTTDYIQLQNIWKQYKIDLKKEDLSHIAGAFVWVTNKANNTGKSRLTFYLDNIQFETY